MYNRSAIKFVPCGRPPRRLSVDMYRKKPALNTTVHLDSCLVVILLIGYRKEPAPNTTYDIGFKPCGRPPDDSLSDDMYRKNKL